MDSKKHDPEMAKQRNGRTASPKPRLWTPHIRTNGKVIERPRLVNSESGMLLISALSAVSLALVTKYAVSGRYWNLNFYFLFVQSGIAIGVMVVLRCYGCITGLTLFDRRKLVRWAPLSLLSVIISYISLRALQCLSLPTYTILTNISTIAIAYAERDHLAANVSSNPTLISFALMVLGAAGALWSDYEAACELRGDKRLIQTLEPDNPLLNLAVGCVLMWAYTLLSTFQAVITPRIRYKTNFKDWDVIWYTNLLAVPISVALSYFIEDFTPENLNDNFRPEYRYSTILALLATGILSAVNPCISFICKQNVGESNYGMASASNKFGIAMTGLLVFGNVEGIVDGIEPVVFAGSGAVLFAWAKGQQRNRGEWRGKRGEWREEGLLPLSVVRCLDRAET